MIPVVIMSATILVLILLSALACHSLRSFSRSRLDEVCQKSGNEARFLEILTTWGTVLIGAQCFLMIVSLTFVSIVVATWELAPTDANRPESGVEWFNLAMKWLGLVATLLLSAIVFPRAIAHVAGEKFLNQTWPLIQAASLPVRPVIWLAVKVDTLAHRLLGLDEPDPNNPETLVDEIRTIVDAGQRAGAIDSNAHTMIDQVMDLKDADVASVMTPRTEMSCLRADLTIAEAQQVFLDAGHTRLPLIGKSTDDIVGILYAKDLLRYIGNDDAVERSLTEVAREAFYVPETTSVDKLLETMNGKRVHLAIVLDEYGGVAGLVTMEDLLEEIVGEIVDEYDDEETDPIQRVSESVTEVDARVHIDDLVEEFNYDLPLDRDYDTIGGFVFSHLGRIPRPDESFSWRNLRFTVLDADPRKLIKLRIERDDSLATVGRDADRPR